jgi:hypothetical protein
MAPINNRCAVHSRSPVTAADLIAPWPRADQLDRAIQNIVRRWLARSLLVTLAGCSVGHDHTSATPQSATVNAPLVGDADRSVSVPRNQQPMLPSIDASPTSDPAAPLDAGRPSDAAPPPVADAALVDPLAPFAPALRAAGSGFDPIDCDAGTWDPMPHIKPSQSFDYAALRNVLWNALGDGGVMINSSSEVTTESHVGTACVNASDAAACTAALDSTRPSPPEANHCGQGGCEVYFVATTLGDMVQQWSTREELIAFLGPIDSPEDALLLAFYDGYNLGHDPSGGCDTAAVRKVDDGYEVYATKLTSWCRPLQYTRYLLKVSATGELTELRSAIAAEEGACIGRRPEGLVAGDVMACDPLGAFFARHAQLEAASVHAFERMIAELLCHGAPSELVAGARAAREDEVRHARLIGNLARSYGADVPCVRVEAPANRSLLAMAIENAAEGCVRETWGALVGTFQAQRASAPDVAAALLEIAADERRHATLSWRVAAWLDTQLSAAERARVAAAHRSAIDALREEEAWPKSARVAQVAGLPDPATALALLEELDEALWTA